MSLEEIVSETLLKQGILGTLLLIFIFMFRKLIFELIKLIKNNTEAMTKNAEALYQVKDVIKKCER